MWYYNFGHNLVNFIHPTFLKLKENQIHGKSKLTNCKACGAEIAKNAKNCPSCGAKNKKKSTIFIIIGAIVLLFIIIGVSGNSDEPQKIDTNSADTTITENNNSEADTTEKNVDTSNTETDKNEFHIGETAEFRDVCATLISVNESFGSDFNTPTDGNIFLICEFEITNNSDSEINVSSILSFEAYCDDYSCNYSLGATIDKGDKNQLDGTVAPGKKLNGIIGYEVPEDWENIEIHFTPNVWSDKDMVFIANND